MKQALYLLLMMSIMSCSAQPIIDFNSLPETEFTLSKVKGIAVCQKCLRPKRQFCCRTPCLRTGINLVGQAVKDAFWLNANLISADSFIVIAATLPVYLFTRVIDDHVQCHFFSHYNHKNINQFPCWCHELARFSVGVPIAILGSLAFLSDNAEWAEAGWMLLVGLPFLVFGKDIIKKFDADFCLRPWHQDFLKDHKRSLGGFPSGHMAEAVFIATLYGLRFGPQLGVPLSFFAAALGIIFLNCNRHYASQIVAGAGLGVLYGVAANKVIDSKLGEEVSLNFCFDRGGPALKACYRF